MVYIGSPHRKLAEYFLAYLASRDYNMQIVADADGEPPNPKYTLLPAFLDPPQFSNERGCSGAFAQAMRTTAIPTAHSPFILGSTVQRIIFTNAEAGYMAAIYTAPEAAQLAASRINQVINRNIGQSRRLRACYARLVRVQNRINRLRAQGRKVPLNLISNPFYRRYYLAQGWAVR